LTSPVIFFLIWAASALLLLKRSFSKEAVFVAVVLLTFLPASISLTQGGKYSEEILGAPLVFFMLLFLLRFVERQHFADLLGTFLAAYFLALAWPQFPAPFLGAGFVAVAMFFLNRRIAAFSLSGALLLALLLGHAVSVWFLGTDYSPLYMLIEGWQGFSNIGDADIRLAMGRNDWSNANPFDFFIFFGGAGVFLFAAGLLRSFLFRAPFKDIVMIAFSGIGLTLFYFFLKSSSLFLPIFVVVAAYGGEMMLSRSRMDDLIFKAARRVFRIRKVRFLAKAVLAIFAGILIAAAVDYFVWISWPQPAGELAVSGFLQKMTPGVSYPVEIILRNSGAPTLKEKNAFAGLHIEVKNALVKSIRPVSDSGGRVVIKPNAVAEEWFWFETAFPQIDRFGQASAEFVVTPLYDDVEIRMRGWLPGQCSFVSRLLRISERGGNYWNPFTQGWRSEACLVRVPANQTLESPTTTDCKAEVFAGYRSSQNFKCLRYPAK
jgi:hypothetical protein